MVVKYHVSSIQATLRATDLAQFRVPAVRHLAWMCHAPQLLESDLSFYPSSYLVDDVLATLRHWDSHPETGPAVLTDIPKSRLGLYFEELYECLLTNLLGYEVLARNLQIRGAERTLGELDFVVRNPRTHEVEHHEVAVKFYLGVYRQEPGATFWHGPNAIDRLDLKTRSLLEQQSQRTLLTETAAALQALGISQPVATRIFMPGYLFYPFPDPLDQESSVRQLCVPPQVPANHERGHWLYLEQARRRDTRAWVHLQKPHWLGPWVQAEAPDASATEIALDAIETTGTPRLFALVRVDAATNRWKETERFFIVPTHWPNL
ncbi:MAG: DUF1853 family protein [Gammaproteobacteria bacterium]|nr:DUF1853 family protein [Gammaproteobacteria bacterium]